MKLSITWDSDTVDPTEIMEQSKLLLEVWEDFDEQGKSLPCLLYAGPRGEESRHIALGPNARLVTTIRARCHFEAMTCYYELMRWGEYTTGQKWDHEPYPQEWIAEQRAANDEGKSS